MMLIDDLAQSKRLLTVGIVLSARVDRVIGLLVEPAFDKPVSEVITVCKDGDDHTSSVVNVVSQNVTHELTVHESGGVVGVYNHRAVLLELF